MPITTTGSIYYFKDDLGNPLVGGKVYTYEYKTSKPKDTYKTGARITPHTNPVILNDSGSVEWYLKDDYTLRVFDANDVFLEEQDIVAPSKAQLDVVSDKLDLLLSELGDAAYKYVGEAIGNVMAVGEFGLGTSSNADFKDKGVATVTHFFNNQELKLPAAWNATKPMSGVVINRGGKPFAIVTGSDSELKISQHNGISWRPLVTVYTEESKIISDTKNESSPNVVVDNSGSLSRSTVRTKIITGVLGATPGSSTAYEMGFDADSVLSCSVMAYSRNNYWVNSGSPTKNNTNEFDFTLAGTQMTLTSNTSTSSSVHGRPFKAFITYRSA